MVGLVGPWPDQRVKFSLPYMQTFDTEDRTQTMFMQLAPPAREYCLLQPREPQICHIHLVSTEKQEMQRYNRSRGGFNFDTGEGFYS